MHYAQQPIADSRTNASLTGEGVEQALSRLRLSTHELVEAVKDQEPCDVTMQDLSRPVKAHITAHGEPVIQWMGKEESGSYTATATRK